MKKRTTIKDIARFAEVTPATVSQVINNKGGYSTETEEKIQRLIQKYNYIPNHIAKSLKTKKTKNIGVIFPDTANVHFSILYKGISECAEKRGYTIIFGCSYYDDNKEEQQVDSMLNRIVDGIIFSGGNDQQKNMEKVHKMNIPIVVSDRFVKDIDCPLVNTNNKLGVEKSVDYLVKHGHKNIKYITYSPEFQKATRDRCNGFISGLKKNNIPFNPDSLIIDDSLRLNEIDGTYNLVKKMFGDKENMPTAFILLADVFAIGIIKALKELGYKIPEDISIMGFDDSYLCKYLEPELTSVSWMEKELGYDSVNLLIDLIEEKEIGNKNIILPTEIIERQSVRHLK